MKKFKKTLIKITIIVVVLLFASIYFISHFHYSEGSRTGYLSKFSKQGYVFKTYEGELFIGGVNAANSSVINTTWKFSVDAGDKAVIDSLDKNSGKIVKLDYYMVIKNFSWQGEQPYFIHKASFVREK